MPFTVDEAKLRDTVPGQAQGSQQAPILSLDPLKPPVKSIPTLEFPRVVYKHPREPYKIIEHRNTRHELVDEEHVPTEHLTKVIACSERDDIPVCSMAEIAINRAMTARPGSQPTQAPKCEACEAALEEALADGWVLEPYIAPALPDRNADLYDAPPARTGKSKKNANDAA